MKKACAYKQALTVIKKYLFLKILNKIKILILIVHFIYWLINNTSVNIFNKN